MNQCFCLVPRIDRCNHFNQLILFKIISSRLWDVRAPSKQACVCTVPDAHEADVNVLSWSDGSDQLIVSGGDDAILRVWSMKTLQVYLKQFLILFQIV
jgi:WD40 repeat protein